MADPETAAIVGIYGEIDRRVNEQPLLRPAVAQLLSPYQQEPDLHWYGDFVHWLREEGQMGAGMGEGEAAEAGPGEAFPDLEGALKVLNVATKPAPRALARRMFAIAVAARVFPEMTEESEVRNLAISALHPGTGPGSEASSAEQLYAFLAGEEPMEIDAITGSDAWWERVVKKAITTKVISKAAIGMYPKPCTGWWVRVPGIEGPVDALRTFYEPEGIKFIRATNFLEPLNWATCGPDFWCKVEELGDLGNGQKRYLEVVSTHCGNKTLPGLWAETELLFNFMWIPDRTDPTKAEAAIANYQLAPGRPGAGDLIVIDEGTVVVARAKDTNKLRVTTTKRIRFSREFVPGAIAMIMCSLGYGDMGNNLLVCAAQVGKKAPQGTPFPGVTLGSPPTTAGAAPAAAAPAGAGGGPGQAPPGGVAQEFGNIWARAILEGARAVENSFGAPPRRASSKRSHRQGGGAMSSRITDCVQDYNDFTTSMLEEWSALASKSASKLDAGTYNAGSAAEDAAAGTVLAAQAGWRWAALWLECLSGAGAGGGFQGWQKGVVSEPFNAPAGARLTLRRAFSKGPGFKELPASAMTIHPEQLEPGETKFAVRTADGLECPGATYVAEVIATTGNASEPMWVWITIP